MTTLAPPLAPIRYGPTGKPKHTLGWVAAAWACEHLLQPDRNIAGRPWTFTDEQLRFLLWFYAIDETGRWLYTYAVLRRMKGWGKDPLSAVIAAIEFVGPCRFDGWEHGEPKVVSQPAAWVQVAATALPQTRNTFLFFPSLFSPATIQEHRIDLGKEIIYADGGKRQIQAVTSSARVIEGGRATLVICGEALALDTPLPTLTGWTTVGGVNEGDMIYGSHGPVMVKKATEVYAGRPCFKVVFEDGTELIADDGHLWQTRVNESDAKPKVRTTGQLYKDGRRFAVPLS